MSRSTSSQRALQDNMGSAGTMHTNRMQDPETQVSGRGQRASIDQRTC